MKSSHKDLKIAFVQAGDIPYLGIMSLSAVLKEQGYATEAFSIDLEADIAESLSSYDPDIVACSVMSPVFSRMMKIVSDVKKRNPRVFTVMGGPHASFFPEIIQQEQGLDAVCRGEGEGALLELADSLRTGTHRYDIKNMWIRRDGGEIVKNDLRDLIADLDTLPFPDRDVFFKRYPFMASGTVRFMMSRGCPFLCCYCLNTSVLELYKGKGRWLRFKSAERGIAEIKEVKDKYPIRWVSFMDETFNADQQRLKKFLDAYKKDIGLPFLCQLRVDVASEEQLDLLKDAGVERVSFGVEHGDEAYRKSFLRRNISDKQILDCGRWVRQRKIRLFTQNIIGFPDETVEKAMSTIMINSRIKPELADCSILNPYPGTQVYRYAKENGYLPENFDFNDLGDHSNWYLSSHTRVKSFIKNEHMPELINLRCFFMLLVWFPWLKPVVVRLIKLPYNRFYELLWHLTGSFRISWRFADAQGRRDLVKKLFKTLFNFSG